MWVLYFVDSFFAILYDCKRCCFVPLSSTFKKKEKQKNSALLLERTDRGRDFVSGCVRSLIH